jgi:16S rRNA C967 or C1407 C5-methylase (RsmB/RsmF family)
MSSGNGSLSLGQAKYNRTIAGTLPSQTVFRLDSARNRKVQKEKEKKMGWFKRKFAQWCREAWENTRHEDKTYAVVDSVQSRSIDANKCIRFTLYPASGGYVIEHYKHERMRESDGPTLTIVNNGDSIGQAIEHAIAIETLKA